MKQTVIGVIHNDENISLLKHYIDCEIGTPKKLMVELPEEASFLEKHNYKQSSDDFFVNLIQHYHKKGSKIIYGDKDTYGHHGWFRDYFLFDKVEELLSEETQLQRRLGLLVRGAACLAYSSLDSFFLHPYVILSKRNEFMLKKMNSEKPDVAVLGDAHAIYLKSKMPKIKYVRFLTKKDQTGIQNKIAIHLTPILARPLKNPFTKPDVIVNY